ncbi:hypothetical protein [Brachyspira hyodysenteriae]|uniref:hypothetical protein n=1 Tax=Brachyspira hyodysenteriae TaxID=159 RepID=UPI0022CD68CA|nr:hypothetical protein [Brachyspira hyodysenteriae]MDA0015301.1 hypothetical protein [Brachyspira hyodysenteriae]
MRREEKRREEKRREEKRREEKRREENLSKIQSNNTSYIKNYNQCFNYFNWNIGFFILNNFGDN